VFRLVRTKDIKVTLDGQGGDELLAGYLPYYLNLFFTYAKNLELRELLHELYWCIKRKMINRQIFNEFITRFLPVFIRMILKLRPQMSIPPWLNKTYVQEILYKHYYRRRSDIDKDKIATTRFEKYLYNSFKTLLPSLLRYTDKNSMAYSIESRVPFLDYRLVEFVFSLSAKYKISDGYTKSILRTTTKDIIPELVRLRTDKIGFATPEEQWFRTELKSYLTAIINSDSFQRRKYFDGTKIKKLFDAHCKGKGSYSRDIWRAVNLELWLRKFIDPS
jgi:asparagine synthase (glutamine-hydrolysing)